MAIGRSEPVGQICKAIGLEQMSKCAVERSDKGFEEVNQCDDGLVRPCVWQVELKLHDASLWAGSPSRMSRTVSRSKDCCCRLAACRIAAAAKRLSAPMS